MVLIYGNSRCGWCEKAKDLADRYELPYEYRNVDNDHYLNELKIKLVEAQKRASTIPQIWWNGNYIGGYEDFAQEIENTLGASYGQERF